MTAGSPACGVTEDDSPPMRELTRRRALVAGVAFVGATAVYRMPSSEAQPLGSAFEALEHKYNRRIGLFAVDVASERSASYRDDQLFAMCSTFKGYAAARVLQMSERGELRLDEDVFVDPSVLLPNSPRTQQNAGSTMTLAELCQAALQVSDNAAANLLLRAIGGPAAITAFARSIGDEVTRLDRWETELNTAIPGDPRDTSTPRALGTGYRNLLDGNALDEQSRQRLQNWMLANDTSSMRAGLPPKWTSADKTGNGDYGSTNDVGMAYGPGGERLLLAIMTRSLINDRLAQNLRPLIGEITALVVPALL